MGQGRWLLDYGDRGGFAVRLTEAGDPVFNVSELVEAEIRGNKAAADHERKVLIRIQNEVPAKAPSAR